MKKILFILIVPLLIVSCREEADNNNQDSGKKYELLSISTEDNSIYLTYSYPTVDVQGHSIRLSSALMAYNPAQRDSSTAIRSVIIGCHITINADHNAPSRLKTTAAVNDVTVINLFPKSAKIPELRQSVIIVPDYEGFGISLERAHPSLSQEISARQVADAAQYGLELYKDLEQSLPFADDWKSFCLGYSQGGAVALATQRYIERNALDDDLHFAGSFCGDGPYDLIETLKYYMLDDGTSTGVRTAHTKATVSLPVVMPLIVKGMLDSDPRMKTHSITDYFSKPFLDTGIIDWITAKQLTTDEIAESWYKMCQTGYTAKDGTSYSAEQTRILFPVQTKTKQILGYLYEVNADLTKILNPDVADYLSDPSNYSLEHSYTGDKMDYLMTALESNSVVTGWKPIHKIILLHSKYDMIVPVGNLYSFTSGHADADIRTIFYGSKDHQETGTDFYLALLNTTFSEDLVWLFAEN